MPILQIRNLPDEIYFRLKTSASDNHRSLAQEATALLEFALDNETRIDNKRRRTALLKRIRGLKTTRVNVEDISEIVRNDRDR